MEKARSIAAIGACMSDLVAYVHALVTETETDHLLAQRIREIKATLGAISNLVDNIAEERALVTPDSGLFVHVLKK
jgi:hypothetical protein